MGVQLGDIIVRNKVEMESLKGRRIAIDAYNSLYQFLSIIRQPDGSPLMDSKGRVTSHLSGLFYRTVKMIEAGIMPAYVFDGEPPQLKKRVLEERHAVREEARERWTEARESGELEEARRWAQAASRLTPDMAEESKKLLGAMGVPSVQAPSEGEAQAAHMAIKKDVWAAGSQDYDSLLFGAPFFVRNLTLTGRRKLPRQDVWVLVSPEVVELRAALGELGITREQLIDLAILVGTDFNPGIKGIGPKKALAYVKEKKPIERAFKDAGMDIDVGEVREIFLKPRVTDDYKLAWRGAEKDKVLHILVDEHEFSYDRISKALDGLSEYMASPTQSRLDEWSA